MTIHSPSVDADLRLEIQFALHDWLDFQTTDRRVVARRVRERPLPSLEAEMLKSALHLVEDGRISVIVRKKAGITTYLAERVL